MEERGNLIRDTIPNALTRILRALLEQQLFGLKVSGKDGTGRKAKVPWVRVYSPEHSPNPTAGWYVVFLFAFDGSAVYLSLNQGTTHFVNNTFVQKPDQEILARVRWAREFLADQIGKLGDLFTTVQLKDTGRLGGGYELGNVCALRYARGNVPAEEELRRDLGIMLDLLNRVYTHETHAGPNVPDRSRMRHEGTPIAEMIQDNEPLTEDELAESGLVRDDAMTLELAAMTGGQAHLSEETIEAIAERVAEKVMSQLRAHIESDVAIKGPHRKRGAGMRRDFNQPGRANPSHRVRRGTRQRLPGEAARMAQPEVRVEVSKRTANDPTHAAEKLRPGHGRLGVNRLVRDAIRRYLTHRRGSSENRNK
jgi:hypothetical protein